MGQITRYVLPDSYHIDTQVTGKVDTNDFMVVGKCQIIIVTFHCDTCQNAFALQKALGTLLTSVECLLLTCVKVSLRVKKKKQSLMAYFILRFLHTT